MQQDLCVRGAQVAGPEGLGSRREGSSSIVVIHALVHLLGSLLPGNGLQSPPSLKETGFLPFMLQGDGVRHSTGSCPAAAKCRSRSYAVPLSSKSELA